MIATATKPTGSMKKSSEAPSQDQVKSVQALILAGARSGGDPLAIAHHLPSKAHILVAGKSMLGRVLDAVASNAMVRGISVIGLQQAEKLAETEAWPPHIQIEGKDGPAESVANALGQHASPFPTLVTTCDHALLTPEIVDTFLRGSHHTDADVVVALAKREQIETAYPNVARTYIKFGDSPYSSCNLFYLKTDLALSVIQFWQTAEADRKRPWRIAWRFGVISALRLLIGRPNVDAAFEIISKRLGVKIVPVILPFADAAIDVDKPDDLALVEHILSERGS